MGQLKELLALIVQRSLQKQAAHFSELLALLFSTLCALLPWVLYPSIMLFAPPTQN